jgi:cytochrome P450
MHESDDWYWPPPAPDAAHYDEVDKTWVLSRHAEVDAALRETGLRQTGVGGKDAEVSNDPKHPLLLSDLRLDTRRLATAEWRTRMVELARDLFNGAATGKPVNLVSRVIKPWSTAVGLEFSGADEAKQAQLGRIAKRISHAHDNPDLSTRPARLGWAVAGRYYRWRHRRAQKELEGLVRAGQVNISRALYGSMTQSLPSLLSKAWLALLHHPDQMELLRSEPDRMPDAVEELLRYAGIVRSLTRRAACDLEIGEAKIAKGDLVSLRLETANRDPSRYEAPEQLDISRRRNGNLALGAGAHACPGSAIIRLTLSVVTPIFLAAQPEIEPGAEVQWLGDRFVTWPSVIPVRLKKQAGNAPE